MNPGRMRHRVTFLSPPEGEDSDGFPNIEWTEHVTVWASVETLKGRSFFEAAKTQMQDNKVVTIRYHPNVDDSMRIRFNKQDYDITSLTNDDMLNKSMTIVVKEAVM
ncbi:phage head closure protein [Sporosarcina sp. E16_8]|uniref:phage head closure protein n=1 Tax=Sporosarcina sp. E16_8 TaxID=2789295 RepID=UPI001A92EC3B|nr:phage head closure protein [Sporosarcina sp. E16_8]MBO0586119.1 phage head closure protein [Sporosarcina sp. E16_8]